MAPATYTPNFADSDMIQTWEETYIVNRWDEYCNWNGTKIVTRVTFDFFKGTVRKTEEGVDFGRPTGQEQSGTIADWATPEGIAPLWRKRGYKRVAG